MFNQRGPTGLSDACEGFTNREGLGVEGTVDGHAIVAGRPALLADRALHLSPALEAARQLAQARGQTAIAAGWDGHATAAFIVADASRPTSADAIKRLKALGLRPVLPTGDNMATAQTVANEVGIAAITSLAAAGRRRPA